MWKGPGWRMRCNHDARAADSSTTWRHVHEASPEAQSDVVVVGPLEQQLGDRRHRRPTIVSASPWGSPKHATSRRSAGVHPVAGRRRPERPGAPSAPIGQPATGLSSETLLLEVDWRRCLGRRVREALVARLPPAATACSPTTTSPPRGGSRRWWRRPACPPSSPWPSSSTPSWVGAPFLLMPRIAGRVVRTDKPFLRSGWLAEASGHRSGAPACGLPRSAGRYPPHRRRTDGRCDFLRGAPGAGRDTLAGELDHWARYLAWAAEGDPPGVFSEAVAWCRDRLPAPRARRRCCGVTSNSATFSSPRT